MLVKSEIHFKTENLIVPVQINYLETDHFEVWIKFGSMDRLKKVAEGETLFRAVDNFRDNFRAGLTKQED